MKKLVPFKKDIIFKNNLAEITSISLEHTLHFEKENQIEGNFTVSGEYKITDTSINIEEFSYELPFEIHMDEKYLLEHATVDINDFYYEIVNNNVLAVNIEVIIDHLEERLLPEKPVEESFTEEEIDRIIFEETTDKNLESFKEDPIEEEKQMLEGKNPFEQKEQEVLIEEKEDPRCIEQEDKVEKITSIFDSMDDSNETYQSYKVYIVREGDTIETILEKYMVTKEELNDYNELKELKLGDKIIIPTHA